ncbi:MAG: hypothetical protein IJV04_00910, partial [Lachnospiraceae bacterium]|nr:hypothetical protein [Lachnospiraceae bacterium]
RNASGSLPSYPIWRKRKASSFSFSDKDIVSLSHPCYNKEYRSLWEMRFVGSDAFPGYYREAVFTAAA